MSPDERIEALEAKCALLSASLKKAYALNEELVRALEEARRLSRETMAALARLQATRGTK